MRPNLPRTAALVLAALVVGVAGYVGYRALVARRVAAEAERLARVLALERTSHVADVGAGSGDYSIELARHVVPEGRVFATEIEEDGVRTLREKAARSGAGHITVLRAAEDSTNLPTNCCDAVFLRGVYHHITRPAETAVSLRDALRPGGRLAIIDFEPSWFLSTFFPVDGVPDNRGGHGISPAVVIDELERAGLKLVERIDDWGDGQYCLVFQKPQ